LNSTYFLLRCCAGTVEAVASGSCITYQRPPKAGFKTHQRPEATPVQGTYKATHVLIEMAHNDHRV